MVTAAASRWAVANSAGDKGVGTTPAGAAGASDFFSAAGCFAAGDCFSDAGCFSGEGCRWAGGCGAVDCACTPWTEMAATKKAARPNRAASVRWNTECSGPLTKLSAERRRQKSGNRQAGGLTAGATDSDSAARCHYGLRSAAKETAGGGLRLEAIGQRTEENTGPQRLQPCGRWPQAFPRQPAKTHQMCASPSPHWIAAIHR